jgi:hypothetical protein
MRLIRTSMLVAVAACALVAVVASNASAALPEIGRCVKLEGIKEAHKTTFAGKYSNRKCTSMSASSKGKFEWEPGAGTEKTFESPGTLEPVTLETAAGTAVECKNSKQVGEYTGASTETDEISLYECSLSTTKETCQSLRLDETPPTPEAGTIISQPLEGTLGFIKAGGLRPQIGWAYKAKTGKDLFVFECGGTSLPSAGTPLPTTGSTPSATSASTPSVGTDITIEGSFISPIIRSTNRMLEEYKLHSVAQGGKQSPEMFEGGTADTLTATILEVTSLKETSEAIGFSAPEEEQSFSEDMEFKATP